MADGDQIVRITYQQLEEIVGSPEPDSGNTNTKHASQSSRPSQQKHLRQRRPAQQIYRPGQLRYGKDSKSKPVDDHSREFGQEENWDAEGLKLNSTDEDGSRGSKESSGDVFSHDVQKRLDDLHIGPSSPMERSEEDHQYAYTVERNSDPRRRGKRPEMQRYIPKGKVLDRDRRSEEKDNSYVLGERDPESENNLAATEAVDPGGGGSSLPRRVHVKSQEGGMRVTVVNESIPSLSSSPSNNRSPLLERKQFKNRHDREFNSSERGRGGEFWGNMGAPSQRRGRNLREAVSGGVDSTTWKEGGRRFSNKEERNSALKSYARNRRSNSSDSRTKQNQEESTEKKQEYTFSSETFPRTKSGGVRSHQAASAMKDLNGSALNKSSAGRDGDKLYMGVTRQRTGSISSEASCASYNSNGSMYSNSSDWYTEEDEPQYILNWAEEVEKAHLEEVARLVHHGAQELTSSLNQYPATGATGGDSATHEEPPASVPKVPVKGVSPEKTLLGRERPVRNRNKRRTRSRKGSSQYGGSRDSSVHSSIQGDDDCFSERGGLRRRRRRRHNSGRSQSGRLEGNFREGSRMGVEESPGAGDENRSGLSVTFGRNNRQVAVNRDGKEKNQSHLQHHHPQGEQGATDDVKNQEMARGEKQIMKPQETLIIEGRKDRDRQPYPRREKDLPPRFRRESGGGGGGGAGGDPHSRRGKGRGGRAFSHEPEPTEPERAMSSREVIRGGGGGGFTDRRLVDPSHDASSSSTTIGSRVSQRGRGNRGSYHNNTGTGGRSIKYESGRDAPQSQRHRANSGEEQRQRRDSGHAGDRQSNEGQSRKHQQSQQQQHQPQQQQQHGLIHLPPKSDVMSSPSSSHHPPSSHSQHHSRAPHAHATSAIPISSTAAGGGGGGGLLHHHQSHSLDNSQMAGGPPPLLSTANSRGPIQGQRQLFDPSNPSTPIVMSEAKPQLQQQQQPPPMPQFLDTEPTSPHSPLSSVPFPVGSPSSPSPSYPSSSSPSSSVVGPVSSASLAESSLTMSYPPSFYPPPHHHHPMYGGGYRPPHPSMGAPPPFHHYPPMGPHYPPHPQGSHHMFYRYPRMPTSTTDMPTHYYGSEVEAEGSRMQTHMMAEQMLRDSSPFECQLGNILSRRPLSDDSQRMLNQIRFELQNRLEQVILLDIEVANKHNVEQSLWKSVYYQIIEAHRKRMADDPQDVGSKEKLIEVLSEGNRFFENLLQRLQSTHSFDLEAFTDRGRPESENMNRYVKLALLSAQRIMMFLGDIARYREQLSETTNYGKARQWYLKAQKLHPRNGRPYNQLAILAVYTKRKLDAVYYYTRSLAASNPILTARESLMSLFDEVRRKVEVVEKKRLEERRQRLARHKKRKSLGARLEIWVGQDGTQTQDTTEEGEDDDLSALSPVELNKRFTLTFLNVHGKLFTKINFESFAESSSLMLQELSTLLQHSPSVINSTRFLQLMGINMFAIDNTALKDESLEASCRSVLQEHAVQVGLEMFGLLVNRAAELLSLQLETEKRREEEQEGAAGAGTGTRGKAVTTLDEDVHQMLPALKAWVDWMMCHAQLWNPQPFNRPPELGPEIDIWKSLARLCDLLNDMDPGHVGLTREKLPGTEPVVLEEDVMLSGFVPMLSAPQEVFYADASADKRQSEDWLRIEKLRLFGEYLCGVEPPMLAFDVDSGKYHSVAVQPEGEMKLEGERHSDQNSGDESDEVVIEAGSDTELAEGGDEQKERIQRLKRKKAVLSKQREERERNKENTEAILASHRHAKIELEVHPVFLIPDTNCFIDHFTCLKAILNCRKYTLVVPLVVINELDGLARGARPDHAHTHSPEHALVVQGQARAAVAFLEEEFEGKHPNLRAQTSKGSVLETIAFRSEEASSNTGINDDIILSCCLHYCKDKAREFMPRSKDGPVRLHREVVLLTEDRNLRLKAHTCNVPVRDVPSFKRWSKIP